MSLLLTVEKIAQAIRCPTANVAKNWPIINQCLQSLPGCGTTNSQIGALSTIAVETAYTFKPIHEYGNHKYLGKEGADYFGRGFIQLTHRYNYEKYGKLLGIDMLNDPTDPTDDLDPEKASDPVTAAAIFAAFWHEQHCYQLAEQERWADLRKRVNGGLNGYSEFLGYVFRLLAANKTVGLAKETHA